MANIKGLNKALENVEMTYGEVVAIANDILNEIITPVNLLVREINENAAGMSPETIRDYMLRLQLRSFELSEIKEKSSLKSACADALRREKYAQSFNAAEGTAGVKDNTAFLASTEEVIIQAVYELVASLLKTKLDEIHRLIDTLKSILMSKMQEAKLAMAGIE